jgi:hypothetical protein
MTCDFKHFLGHVGRSLRDDEKDLKSYPARSIARPARLHQGSRRFGRRFSFDEAEPGFQAGFGDELFSLTPPDSACYTYPMVNRQDALYSPRSSEIGRHLLLVEIIFGGTKLAIDRSRPNTTTDGINRSSEPFRLIRPAN